MIQTKYPGVYIEEIKSSVHTIMGVSTSVTAFVGRAKKGRVNRPVTVYNFSEYSREFGGLWEKSTMSYAVQQYFLNGGSEAVIVRITDDTVGTATRTFSGIMTLDASSPGEWGNNLQVAVDYDTSEGNIPDDTRKLFNLIVKDPEPVGSGGSETIRNLSSDPGSPAYVERVLEQQSRYLRARDVDPSAIPAEGAYTLDDGSDGGDIDNADFVPTDGSKTGIYALEDTDIFNLLCLPPIKFDQDVLPSTYNAAATYCRDRRAMLLVDVPGSFATPAAATASPAGYSLIGENAAMFYPRIRMADPLKKDLLQTYAPSGAIAGVFARTDSQRGIWKAPAGIEATLVGVSELSYTMTDNENGALNPLGVNCLRTFPAIGTVVWGSRTMKGADALANEWKYIPVRRMALYIEESLYRGTKWVVFEPNDEPLWAQIRLNVGAFMQNLFRQGAFQGKSPREAYLVKCDAETTTQDDINRGVVNILVGFAPLKPAEFVIIKIQQMAGEIKT